MNQPPSPEQRASDQDRETVARWLATAAGHGRITTEEMEERLARVRVSRTYGDLAELVRDLPEMEQPGLRTMPETLRVSASLRDARLRGAWRAPPRIVASAGRGSVLLDFTRAVVDHDQVTVDARPNWRNVVLVIPDEYTVSTEETAPGTANIRDLTTGESAQGGTHIHVVVQPGLGTVLVRRPRQPRPRRERKGGLLRRRGRASGQ